MVALLQTAAQYIEGTVESGKQLGRTIGFPTANIRPAEAYALKKGVYGGYVFIHGKRYMGVMNVGNRPTFKDGHHVTVEVHILNFNETIYAEHIVIEPMFPIRLEKKFSGVQALIEQLKQDVQYAIGRFAQYGVYEG